MKKGNNHRIQLLAQIKQKNIGLKPIIIIINDNNELKQ